MPLHCILWQSRARKTWTTLCSTTESSTILKADSLFCPAEAGVTNCAMEQGRHTWRVSGSSLCIASGHRSRMTMLIPSHLGLTAGGLWGLREGISRSRNLGMNPTLNSTLNQAAQAASASTFSALNTAASATSTASAAPQAAAQQATAAAASSAKTAEARATAAVRSPAFRVRLNAVLNSITRRGTFVGNNAGVLGESRATIGCIFTKA